MGRPRRMHRLRLIEAAIRRNREAIEKERRMMYASAARVAKWRWHLQRLERLRERLCVDNAQST